MAKLYEIFSNDTLKIAELIQRRRLQLLVHSCIYYELNDNLISDRTWDMWSEELIKLQKTYPEVAEKVVWNDAFKNWDGSTGAFLPIRDKWVLHKAYQLTGRKEPEITQIKLPVVPKKKKNLQKNCKKLF